MNKKFWNKEYKGAGRTSKLTLSNNPSEDLVKFCEWLEYEFGKKSLNVTTSATDLGCGNGRNLIYLSKTYGMRGFGCDISEEAISQAKKSAVGLPLVFKSQSIAQPFPIEDNSETLILDMMTSHFLNMDQRKKFLSEILRILKPGGFLFFKTFLLDDDQNAIRMLKDYPADEAGSYIHPSMKVAEHVFTEKEIVELLTPEFYIHKTVKSHGHLRKDSPKRRSICVYAEKN